MHVPARLEPDRPRSTAVLAELLRGLAGARQRRPSVVHVVAPAPTLDEAEQLRKALRKLRARRAALRWTATPLHAVVLSEIAPAPAAEQGEASARPADLLDPQMLPAMERAVVARATVAQRRGETLLRKLGVKVVKVTRGSGLASAPADDTPKPAAPAGEGAVA
jgi:hypothetical protein